MNKLIQNPKALSNILKRIAIEAGEITLKYFDDLMPDDVDRKADGSPVSLADKEAEDHIEKALKDLMPEIPVVGEEAVSEGKKIDLTPHSYFWLVDPLDGTKEFISGGEDFTVNIALIHEQKPIIGVVYAPALGNGYSGYGQGTATRWNEDNLEGKSVKVRPYPESGITVIGSRRHGNSEKTDKFLEEFKVAKMIKRGSSLKICAIAEGKADLYPRFGPTCEWDTAAGHAVLNAAGGFLTKTDGSPLIYGGSDPKFLNPEFIASGFEWFGE